MKDVLIAAVTILSFLCGAAGAADKIRVGVPQQVVHWMVFPLAQQKGFFKEEGFDAEIVRITGPSGRSALMSGDIDYYTTIAFIVQSAILGLPVKVVAAYVNCPPFVLMSRPEFKSAQDLKGKTMGIGAPPGSSPDVIAKLSLRHLGLNPDREVKFVYLNSHERTFLALEQGLYAAGLISPPFDFQGKKLGFNSLARADELLTYPEDGLIATVKKIKEKHDEVKRVIRGGHQGQPVYPQPARRNDPIFNGLAEGQSGNRERQLRQRRASFQRRRRAAGNRPAADHRRGEKNRQSRARNPPQ
jgi:ABC-type nitrate/sulfonate/bicarbonate transport system substrate-binding protein